MASLWNQYYTEEELERAKARALADEFGGMGYDNVVPENIVPIADKKVVNEQPLFRINNQPGMDVLFPGAKNTNQMIDETGMTAVNPVVATNVVKTPPQYNLFADQLTQGLGNIPGMSNQPATPLNQGLRPDSVFNPQPSFSDRMSSLFKDRLFNYDYMMGEVADPRFAGENRAYRALGALANLPLFGATPEMSAEFKKSLEANTQDIRKNVTDRAKAQAAAAGKSIYGKYGTTQLANSLLNEVKSSVNKTFTLGDNASDEEIKGIADNAAKVLVQMESNPKFAGLSETQKRRAAILKAVEDFKTFGGSIF